MTITHEQMIEWLDSVEGMFVINGKHIIQAIRSALQSARDKALEDAASICDELMRSECSPRYCAEKIRAMKGGA